MTQEWSTFGKFTFLREEAGLTPTQFVGLCDVYGLEMSNATVSRAIKAGKFNSHETDQMLRPLVLKLTDLVRRAGAFPISFTDPYHIKLILDLLDEGQDIRTQTNSKTK